jgi:hypothetical protein
MNTIVCPISIEKIDSRVSRLTVFLNVILMALFIATSSPVYIFIVALDYFIRATLDPKYSPLRFIAVGIIDMFDFEKKPIGLAPKIFASRLGFLCALAAYLLVLMGYTTPALAVAGFLMVLSLMDSVLNFCVGCLIYNYLVYPFYKDK